MFIAPSGEQFRGPVAVADHRCVISCQHVAVQRFRSPLLGTLDDAGKVSPTIDVLAPYHGVALDVRALATVGGAA